MARGKDNVTAFFDAVEALTYREMHEVAGLLSLQLQERDDRGEASVAGALADSADSWREADED